MYFEFGLVWFLRAWASARQIPSPYTHSFMIHGYILLVSLSLFRCLSFLSLLCLLCCFHLLRLLLLLLPLLRVDPSLLALGTMAVEWMGGGNITRAVAEEIEDTGLLGLEIDITCLLALLPCFSVQCWMGRMRRLGYWVDYGALGERKGRNGKVKMDGWREEMGERVNDA